MARGDLRRFHRDPLGFLEDLSRRRSTDVFRLPWGGWCAGETELALAVLRDPGFNAGLSTFYGDLLPSRSAQIAVGHAVRNIIRARLPEYRENLAAAVPRLPAAGRWPETGTALVYECLADLLLHPAAAPELRSLLARSVGGGLLIRSPLMRERARAEILRSRLFTALIRHIGRRRGQGVDPGGPRDLLDAVLDACPRETTDEVVAELYVLLFRSIVGNVGYAVAWTVLLAGLHHPPGAPWPWPTDWIVRESARHRPFVWMVGRPVPHPIECGGVALRPGTILSVSPYLLHHDERHWSRPDAFDPERWAHPDKRGPYLPFSAGPFICAGAAVAQTMTTDTVAALAADARLTVLGGHTRPVVTNAAAPCAFTLSRTTEPLTRSHAPERR
ncbi:cytochrome P450 [Embleya scabrispora]|uniref:cytochrome P450 n=1 Tax=Embleya scabrispora TaxID=159449 RepID=UPI0003A4619D|nr:cytochrome P450 [Embleya scabrispora]MYS84820.1 cytochrome P450 [Streptomyces sp. SID5474]